MITPHFVPNCWCHTPHGPMMLVSSSGWAHSPITLIFSGLSVEYGDGGAAPPGTATATATPAAIDRARAHRFRDRIVDRMSPPPPGTAGLDNAKEVDWPLSTSTRASA